MTEAEMDKMTDKELLVAAEKEMKQGKLYAVAAAIALLAGIILFLLKY